MLTRDENELLTRVGPGTPMGALFRRYWLPALLADELPEPDGDPKRVRLLGEDLVAFRDTAGRVGLLAEPCPHRCASLAYGRNEGGGLRCIYHGWKLDVDGHILETPPEPPESTFKDRIKHVAYPTREVGGVVWAYLGPREQMPPFPEFEVLLGPADSRSVVKVYEDCNWAQGVEGSIDSAHTDYLHSANVRGRPRDHAPSLEAEDTPYGFLYAAIRRPDVDGDRLQYVRVTLFVAPCHVLIPPQRGRVGELARLQTWVPIDDEHTFFYGFDRNRLGPLPVSHRADYLAPFQLDRALRPARTRQNGHLQDRAAMRQGDWSGIDGVRSQDHAVVESMGPIVDRAHEHLGVSDVAVIRMRRRLLDAARALPSGADPPGLDPAIAYPALRSEERVIPRAAPWQAALDPVPEPQPAR
ncbi:MAG TPA: Rieske 2Fe-2S domain-containing protein [Chloroflexota bacterium]|jgi:phthalate 4,5-dioxygenase oxygenase subunit